MKRFLLLRMFAIVGWLCSAGLSWAIAAAQAFAGQTGLQADMRLFVYAPLIAAIAFGLASVGKLRSPWIEAIILAAPAYQIAIFALYQFS